MSFEDEKIKKEQQRPIQSFDSSPDDSLSNKVKEL
jgi:hypothetical protein